MTNILPDEKTLSGAFSIIAATSNTEVVIDKLRDLLKVDHVVYYMPKRSGAAFARLTYPASWIKRYLQMNYANVDPISREAAQRTLPFNWSELKIQSAAEASFLADALSHGIGPHGFFHPPERERALGPIFNFIFRIRTGMEGFSGDNTIHATPNR